MHLAFHACAYWTYLNSITYRCRYIYSVFNSSLCIPKKIPNCTMQYSGAYINSHVHRYIPPLLSHLCCYCSHFLAAPQRPAYRQYSVLWHVDEDHGCLSTRILCWQLEIWCACHQFPQCREDRRTNYPDGVNAVFRVRFVSWSEFRVCCRIHIFIRE